jgi:hypothetical protein
MTAATAITPRLVKVATASPLRDETCAQAGAGKRGMAKVKTWNANRAGHLYKPRKDGTLKRAQADLVSAVGGLSRAADLINKGQSFVQECTDEAKPKVELKLSQVRALEKDCGQPIVTAFMALEANHVLVPIEFNSSAPLATDMVRLAEEVAFLFGKYAEASADGKITKQESAELKGKIDRCMSAMAAARVHADAITNEGDQA